MAANGSFTRAIKAKQLEESLRVALAAVDAAPFGSQRDAKTKAAMRIATSLLKARIQLQRSRIADSRPRALLTAGVETKLAKIESGGVEAILKEFRRSS